MKGHRSENNGGSEERQKYIDFNELNIIYVFTHSEKITLKSVKHTHTHTHIHKEKKEKKKKERMKKER